jgi:putative transposase
MSHSYTKSLFHCVFSTKMRSQSLPTEIQSRLWPYIGGIARTNGMTALAVGGIADHAHVFLSIPATVTLAKAVQLIKAGSSKWLHDSFPIMQGFAWQEGYGAFSIGISQIDMTIRYIERQPEHHRTLTFEDEFERFLKRHGLEFDRLHPAK